MPDSGSRAAGWTAVAGALLVLVAIFADNIGLGREPGFGGRQVPAAILGTVLFAAGMALRGRSAATTVRLLVRRLENPDAMTRRVVAAAGWWTGWGLVAAGGAAFWMHMAVEGISPSALGMAMAGGVLLAADRGRRRAVARVVLRAARGIDKLVLFPVRGAGAGGGSPRRAGPVQGVAGAVLGTDPLLGLVFALPYVWCVVDGLWVWTIPLYVDPWMYYGLLVDPLRMGAIEPAPYHAERLSWILPGAAVHAVLPYEAAHLLLHFAVHHLACGSLYVLVREAAGRRAGLFAAVGLGTFSPFLWAVGWDYVDGVAMAYLLGAMAVSGGLERSARPGLRTVAAGVMFGLAVHANMFVVIFGLPAAVWHFAANPSARRRPTAELLRGAAGFVLVTTVFAVVSGLLWGRWFFFRESLRSATGGNDGLAVPPPLEFARWPIEAGWTAVILVLSVASAAFLAARWLRGGSAVPAGGADNDLETRSDLRPTWWVWPASAALMTAVFVAFQLRGMPLLTILWYADYLYPLLFAGLGVAAAGVLAGTGRIGAGALILAGPVATAGLMAALSGGSAAARYGGEVLGSWQHFGVLKLAVGLALAGVAGGVLPAMTRAGSGNLVAVGEPAGSRGRAAVAPQRFRHVAAVVGLLLLMVVPTVWGVHLWRGLHGWDATVPRRAALTTVMAVRALETGLNTERLPVRVWFPFEEPAADALHASVAASYLWGAAMLSTSLPEVPAHGRMLRQPCVVLTLSRGAGTVERAEAALRRSGYVVERSGHAPCGSDPVRLHVGVLRVRPAPDGR